MVAIACLNRNTGDCSAHYQYSHGSKNETCHYETSNELRMNISFRTANRRDEGDPDNRLELPKSIYERWMGRQMYKGTRFD